MWMRLPTVKMMLPTLNDAANGVRKKNSQRRPLIRREAKINATKRRRNKGQ